MAKRDLEDSVYMRTEVIVGNPLDEPDTTIKMVLCEPDDPEMSKSIQIMSKRRFPEIGPAAAEISISKQTITISTITNNITL